MRHNKHKLGGQAIMATYSRHRAGRTAAQSQPLGHGKRASSPGNSRAAPLPWVTMPWFRRWAVTPFAWVWHHTSAGTVWIWQHTAVWIWQHAAARMTGIAALLLGGAAAGTLGLHSLLVRSGSTDAWAAAIEAAAAAVLVLVTAWYVYLTYGLLEAQRTSARTAAWETAARDLSLFVNKNHLPMWDAAKLFPMYPPREPPDVMDVISSRDAINAMRQHLLDTMGLLPREIARKVLPLTAHLVDAGGDLDAIARAMLDEFQLAMAEERGWSWEGVRLFHDGSGDPERNQPWDDLMSGTSTLTAQELWDQLLSDLDGYLWGPTNR